MLCVPCPAPLGPFNRARICIQRCSEIERMQRTRRRETNSSRLERYGDLDKCTRAKSTFETVSVHPSLISIRTDAIPFLRYFSKIASYASLLLLAGPPNTFHIIERYKSRTKELKNG